MSELTAEMLAVDQVDALWPEIKPLLDSACQSHEIAKEELDAESIRALVQQGVCAMIAMFTSRKLSCVLAIQFHETNGRKGADIIAFAGKHMLLFKKAYWHIILRWLRANGVEFLDAYVPESRVLIYRKKLGFDKSCAHLRMNLH